MKIHFTLPLTINVTSYHPGNPGQTSGPPESCYPPEEAEIEFDIFTLTGTELTESDFDSTSWGELYSEVLATYETDRQEAQDEAIIEAALARQDREAEPY